MREIAAAGRSSKEHCLWVVVERKEEMKDGEEKPGRLLWSAPACPCLAPSQEGWLGMGVRAWLYTALRSMD